MRRQFRPPALSPLAEQGEGKNGTGVAYANPSATAALVTFTARDADGEVLAIEDLMLPPNWPWCAKYADPVRSQQLYRIARSHPHGAHRQSVAQFRSRPRIFFLASGGNWMLPRRDRLHITSRILPWADKLANHDHLYQLLPGGGDLSNRFHLRSRKSADGLVCRTGNGGQPDRRSAAGGIRSPGRPTWR